VDERGAAATDAGGQVADQGARIDGKVAVVTGGGGGIGRAISERFGRHGAAVVVAEIDDGRAAETVAAIEAQGGRATAAVGDVRTAAGAEAAVAAAVDTFGGLDVLVNNVGHYDTSRRPFHQQSEEDWKELYRVNLGHVLLCTRAAIPHLLARGGGSIVNVSTVEAFRGIPGQAVYSAFKAALGGFTRSLALDHAHDGIRVNAIAPDVVETLQVPYSRWVPDDQRHLVPTWVPLGRFGTPDDVAGCALFLASDLSGFVTGTTIHVDGGTLAAGGWYPTEEGRWTNRPRRP
jgi:NAD(P)-dependent dehydrogenase (short-subunit alcohol dehydrogenase family)